MMQSKAWGALTNNARVLYLYMKLQYYGQKQIEGRGEDCFYFNKGLYCETYHLYSNTRQFRKDRDLLIQLGFIECIENGKTTRTKSIYKFSNRWQQV